MKLKTLNEIKSPQGLDKTCRRLFERAIKQEAIKWVKDKGWELNVDDWEEFFNIIEEDGE